MTKRGLLEVLMIAVGLTALFGPFVVMLIHGPR